MGYSKHDGGAEELAALAVARSGGRRSYAPCARLVARRTVERSSSAIVPSRVISADRSPRARFRRPLTGDLGGAVAGGSRGPCSSAPAIVQSPNDGAARRVRTSPRPRSVRDGIRGSPRGPNQTPRSPYKHVRLRARPSRPHRPRARGRSEGLPGPEGRAPVLLLPKVHAEVHDIWTGSFRKSRGNGR